MKRLAATLIALWLVTACGPPTPSAKQLLEESSQKTAAATSLRFTLLRTGEPVLLDQTSGSRFSEASGEYQAPDRVHAKVKVTVAPTVLTIDVLWIPDGTYATNPFTGVYAKLPATTAFDPRAMLGANGIPGALRSDVRNPAFVAKDKIGATETYHVRGEVDGSRLKAMTGGVVVQGTHTVDVWIDVSNSYIVRLVATEPGGTKASWQLDLSDFGKPLEIRGP